MYYEPYQKRKRQRQPRRRRRSFGGWLAELCLRLVALALGLALLGAGLLYALPVSLFAVEPDGVDLSLTDGLPADRANILLLGLDAVRENSRRSDAILIASVGYGTLKLTSVMRDTLVEIPGHGSGKLNAAYAYGGPELVMKTLNGNFGLNLMHYASVDFRALVAVVDAVGGVDLEITGAEMEKINAALDEARRRGQALDYDSAPLTQSGKGVHLNGLQALAYARIRKLDSDYGRTRRQRRLLSAMLTRIRSNLWNPAMLARLGRAILQTTDTNLSVVQLLSLGEKALAAGPLDTLQLPVEGSYTDDGSCLRVSDFSLNASAFRAFAYD